jgi:hypothetical protein
MALRKKKPDPVLNWHPNFRVVESLPDIKQVRTGFIVNFITITLALIALVWALWTEIQIHNTNAEVDKLNTQVEGLTATNKKDLAASAKFVVTSKSLQFADRFFAQKLSPVSLLQDLAEARPDDILLDGLEINSIILETPPFKKAPTQTVVITGTLTSDTLLDFNVFVEKVKNCPTLKDHLILTDKKAVDDKFFKPEPRQDITPGAFKFTITITLKPST